jgi:hypothetical protein
MKEAVDAVLLLPFKVVFPHAIGTSGFHVRAKIQRRLHFFS